MKLIGIQRKSDGHLLMVVPQGRGYNLPPGYTRDTVKIVNVYVPTVGDGVPRRLSPEQHQEILKQRKEEDERLQKMAKEQGIGVGDVIAKLTKVFGIKPCTSCEQRRIVANRLRIKNWKIKWVKGEPKVEN